MIKEWIEEYKPATSRKQRRNLLNRNFVSIETEDRYSKNGLCYKRHQVFYQRS